MCSDVAPLLDREPAPFMLLIELPHREIGGICTPYEDLVQMSAHCKRRGVAFHCDGARLWEAEAFYCSQEEGRTMHELVALFDSVYVSFYKGLGGVTGSMLLGPRQFVAEARIW
jgi:threonine aldolase